MGRRRRRSRRRQAAGRRPQPWQLACSSLRGGSPRPSRSPQRPSIVPQAFGARRRRGCQLLAAPGVCLNPCLPPSLAAFPSPPCRMKAAAVALLALLCCAQLASARLFVSRSEFLAQRSSGRSLRAVGESRALRAPPSGWGMPAWGMPALAAGPGRLCGQQPGRRAPSSCSKTGWPRLLRVPPAAPTSLLGSPDPTRAPAAAWAAGHPADCCHPTTAHSPQPPCPGPPPCLP